MNYKKYIGTKKIEAVPMNRGEYNKYRGWTMPADENPNDEGYLVKYSDGYISWSPKKQFEETYRESGSMNFGHALEMMNLGYRVARSGWNSKKMFLFLATTGKELKSDNSDKELPEVTYDVICMNTADDDIYFDWFANQTDMLAEDWEVVE